MPELLAPAGNFEKLRAAVLYGADAVYLAGRAFGMRAAADNFTLPELAEAVAFAHEKGVKVYLTVNVMPRTREYPALRVYLTALREIPVDALIVADIGVLALVKEILPGRAIHISTQANAVSAEACRAYHALGASRVVLARELTLDEIREIRQNVPPELELEAFIHGSMCMAYSGRCLLSSYFTGRDANRGMCTQPCRWHYTITEEKRPDQPLPIEEINGETFFLSSNDMCMIDHIPELIDAGVTSFKIEGRMKSAYYTAVVTNAYRMALSAAAEGKTEPDPAWTRELGSVSHRPYHTGFYFTRSQEDANVTDRPGYLREKAYLAVVLGYDTASGLALCEQKNKFSTGDALEWLTPGACGRPFTAGALFDEERNPIESVPHPQMRFYTTIPFAVRPGDILRAGGEEGDDDVS